MDTKTLVITILLAIAVPATGYLWTRVDGLNREMAIQTTILSNLSRNQEKISDTLENQGKLLERLLLKDQLASESNLR
jgi:hypothetical protein